MEIFLKLYDDADDWLSIAWLASGPLLWTLLVVLLAVSMLAVSIWLPGVTWSILAITILGLGMIPVVKNSTRQENRGI